MHQNPGELAAENIGGAGGEGLHHAGNEVEHFLLGRGGGGAGRRGGLHGVPDGAAGGIIAPESCEVVDEFVEEVGPLQRRHSGGEVLKLGDNLGGVLPVKFADEHIFVGKELIQSANGHFGAPGDFVEGKGFEPDVDKDRAGAGEDAVEAFAASLLRGASAR